MATEAERLLKGSGWLPEALRRADLVAFDDATAAEGQGPVDDADGMVAETPDESEIVELPSFLVADLPVLEASMMAAE